MQSSDYLTTFYPIKPSDGNQEILRFLAQHASLLNGKTYLEFGGGPVIHGMVSVAPHIDAIHFTDYHDNHLQSVKAWQQAAYSYNWSEYVRASLRWEGNATDDEAVTQRQVLLRGKIKSFSQCDAFADDPLLGQGWPHYDVISNQFCLDSTADNHKQWIENNARLVQYLPIGGRYLTIALRNASYWRVNDQKFPAANINFAHVCNLYQQLNFNLLVAKEVTIEDEEGADGFIFVIGEKLS